MGYTNREDMVRVDFFKPSGKWYCTEAVKWLDYHSEFIHEGFKESLAGHLKGRLLGMTAVCLEPYHENSHPISMVITQDIFGQEGKGQGMVKHDYDSEENKRHNQYTISLSEKEKLRKRIEVLEEKNTALKKRIKKLEYGLSLAYIELHSDRSNKDVGGYRENIKFCKKLYKIMYPDYRPTIR